MKQIKRSKNKYNYAGYMIATAETASRIHCKTKVSSDTENRMYVIKKVLKYIKEGKSKDEAIDLVIQEEKVQKDFDYYRKNNIDLRMCVENWIKKPLNKIKPEDFER